MGYKYQEINNSNPYAMSEELEYLRTLALELSWHHQIVMIGAGPCVFGMACLEQHSNQPNMAVVEIGRFDYCEAHLSACGCDMNRVRFLSGDSYVIGSGVWSDKIDLLIIDGDHTYEGVKKDCSAWVDHVKPGGKIFFHDFLERDGGFNGSGPWLPGGVAQAIEECRDSSWLFLKQVGISVVYMKV